MALPSVVIGIPDDKTGQHEKEIHCQITVIGSSHHRSPPGERETFVYVIPQHQYAATPRKPSNSS